MSQKEIMPVAEEHRLIQRAKDGDATALNKLVEAHTPWIKSLARKVCGQRRCGHLFDDLLHEGKQEFGLAIRRFDFEKAHSERAASHNMTRLRTFASLGVNGAMLDFLEREGLIHISRDKQKMVRQLETISRRLQLKLEREPTDSEMAQEMGVSIDDLHALLSMPHLFNSLDEMGEDLEPSAPGKTPEEEVIEWEEKQERAAIVMAAIAQLPPKQKQAITLQIYDDCSVKDIATRMKSNENAVRKVLHDARQNLSQNKELQALSDKPSRQSQTTVKMTNGAPQKRSTQNGGDKDASL